jgi:hypothetical protein
MRILARAAVLVAAAIFVAGCGNPQLEKAQQQAQKARDYKSRKIAQPKQRPIAKPAPARQVAVPATSAETDLIERAYQATRSTAYQTGRPEEVAVRKASRAIDASLELGPTLVVWLFDRTTSSQKLTTQAIGAAKEYYDSDTVRQASSAGEGKLLSAVVGFDEKVDFLLDPPADDWQAVKAALDAIQPASGGKEMTFAAIGQALDKYLKFRTEDRRQMLLIVVTDEAGDDQNLVDDLIATTERYAIPVYAIGSPAPWGQTNPLAAGNANAGNANAGEPQGDDSSPVHGPESRESERVSFSMTTSAGFYGGSSGTFGGNYGSGNVERNLIDSGFGPFALEWLCRASGGEFLIVRPTGSETYSYRGVGYSFWPSGQELKFDDAVVSRYAPDYVSADEYRKLLAQNKARMALHLAAKAPATKIDDEPELRFEKKSEAKMAQQLSKAQQFAARHAPAIDKFYDILQPGEADRDKLTSPRWQAEFDFAFGRVAAAKARVDGYNAMIAALKRGKNFENPSSNTWVLEPSDNIETGSSLQNLAKKAKSSLERVVKDNPGTPWAKIAAEELKTPLGWSWREE